MVSVALKVSTDFFVGWVLFQGTSPYKQDLLTMMRHFHLHSSQNILSGFFPLISIVGCPHIFCEQLTKISCSLKKAEETHCNQQNILVQAEEASGAAKALLYHQSHSPEKRTLGGYAITITINSPIVRFFQIGRNPEGLFGGSLFYS